MLQVIFERKRFKIYFTTKPQIPYVENKIPNEIKKGICMFSKHFLL